MWTLRRKHPPHEAAPPLHLRGDVSEGVSSVGYLQEQAAEDARRLLESAWPQVLSGRGIPVDPVRIAAHLGIDVFDAEMDQNVSGALIKERQQDPAILLNKIDSPNRKRFSCAHELGHYIKRSSDFEQYEYVDYRDETSATGDNPDEVYANSFAASLLMPEREVRRYAGQGLNDIQLALQFGVSREAMQIRLQNLGIRAADSGR